MVQVVRDDAGHEMKDCHIAAGRRSAQIARSERVDGAPKLRMHVFQQPEIGPPGFLGRLDRTAEPVRALDGERSAALSGQPPPDCVLPVGGVHGEFPDIVTIAGGTPHRLREGDVSQGAAQIRPMPRLPVICLIDLRDEDMDGAGQSGGRCQFRPL